MKQDLLKEVVLPSGVVVALNDQFLTVKGPKGETKRNFVYPKIELKISTDKISISSKNATKREKTIVGSFFSHIKNMVAGVVEPHLYKLKICSGHFPMTVTVAGRELIIKNFLGETVPRRVSLPEGADVKINGTEIIVSSVDIETAGQAAANIEQACRITNRDLRVFQDGCYIVQKAGRT